MDARIGYGFKWQTTLMLCQAAPVFPRQAMNSSVISVGPISHRHVTSFGICGTVDGGAKLVSAVHGRPLPASR